VVPKKDPTGQKSMYRVYLDPCLLNQNLQKSHGITLPHLRLKGSGDRKEGRRKEKRNKAYLVLLLVDETS
jgi:hypothetical protein